MRIGRNSTSALRLTSAAVLSVRQALVGLDRPRGRHGTEALVAALVCALTVTAVVTVAAVGTTSAGLVSIGAGLVVPAVLVAWRRSLLAWRVGWLVGLVAPLLPNESRIDLVQVAVVAILFCVAGGRYGRSLIFGMWLLQIAALWVWAATDWRTALAVSVGLSLLAVAVDALVGWWRTRRDLAAQTAMTSVEIERRAVLEERARIAREMHDIVAHHLSLIAVATSTAPYRLPGIEAGVRAEFDYLNAAAREALADTRSLLTTLRASETPDVDREPQPTVAEIAHLVTSTQRAGVNVRLVTTGESRPVRSVVAVSAYRIVQEALANAARHAPGASVDVQVEYRKTSLLIRIRNSEASMARIVAPMAAGGRGIAGMRERVALLNGSLYAGPPQVASARPGSVPGAGFEVCAELPFDGAA